MVTHATAGRPRALLSLPAILVLSLAVGCDKVPLLAPTGTVITLFSTSSTVPATGQIEIIATLIERGTASSSSTPTTPGTPTTPTTPGTTTTSSSAAGTPVQNGTLVSFTTTIGTIEPREARTTNGEVRVKFISNGQSGTAVITAYSGGASAKLENLLVGAAAVERVLLSASPQTLGSTGGTAEVTALVQDKAGTSVAGVPVTFSTDAGTFSQTTVTTDSTGIAKTTLTTNRAAKVKARAGEKESAELNLAVNAAVALTITVTPQSTTAGTPVAFTIGSTTGQNIVDLTIDYGDGQSRSLGAIGTGSTTDLHVYRTPGTYPIRVTARDANGETVVRTSAVSISSVPVTLTASNPSPSPGTVVTFTASTGSASPQVERYQWTLDDPPGTTFSTTGPSMTQSWSSRGQKTVRVDVIGVGGGVLGSAETRINVTGG